MSTHQQPLALRASAKVTRHERALIVRSRVRAWLSSNSRFELIAGEDGTLRMSRLTAIMDGFSISHRTPLFGAFKSVEGFPDSLPYGLDIWAHGKGKVMNLEWGHAGQSELVSFAKGDWDADLLALLNPAGLRQ